MAVPSLPWYGPFERALKPLEGYTTAVLLMIAGVTIVIALKGDHVVQFAWLIYLISP